MGKLLQIGLGGGGLRTVGRGGKDRLERLARRIVAARQRGDDPNELPHRYAGFINKVVAHKPAGMTLAMHLCRGNFKSTHAAAGNYEPVAEALLSEMKLDAFFLEYDDDRSGDFRPLRYLSKDKIVVLGLVTTKFGQLESKDDLKRRIAEAAQYAPLDQLALSPQCGFSSTVHGNNIAVEDQRSKLRLPHRCIQLRLRALGEAKLQIGPAPGDLLCHPCAVLRVAGVNHQADPAHASVRQPARHAGLSGFGSREPAMMAGNLNRPWALSGSQAQGVEQVL